MSNVVKEVKTDVIAPTTVNPIDDSEIVKRVTEHNQYKLKRLSEKFMYELMEVPTASHHEYRMVTFIMIWAKRNGIDYEMDDYGNIYLTKGTVGEGEFFPCVTAHLDTVQTKQTANAKACVGLEVLTRDGKKHGMFDHTGKHEIYVDGFGIGGDDKAGVLIGLSMFDYIDKLKACFFLEEEVGCVGSSHLKKEWFDNVGYVLGYDSPELNRAAFSCGGTKLMNKEFFEDNGVKDICKKHGLVDFRSEPITDVMNIRSKTDIICMNFGTGYYDCHQASEYCVIEEMDEALDMGIDIIRHLGNNAFKLKHVYGGGGYYNTNDADSKYFTRIKTSHENDVDTPTTPNYGGGYNTSHTNPTYPSNTSSTKPNADKVNFEQIKYISEKYEEYIETIKSNLEKKCTELGIDFDVNFSEIFNKEIKF